MSLIAGNLGFIQQILDTNQVPWGIHSGAAAHLYGDRRPIQNVDILISFGQLPTVVGLLRQKQKAVQFDGRRILWRGINFCDDLSTKFNGINTPFLLDAAMVSHLRRMPLLGSTVAVLAPEDILLHKFIRSRGPDHGLYDERDTAAIVRRQKLDIDYLKQRIQLMNGNGTLIDGLRQLGIEL